jgi:uncharacterized cupin superfamily protein
MIETSPMNEIVPIALEKSYLEGKGLVANDPSANDDSVTTEEPVANSEHLFHLGKIYVSVIESAPAKVRIDNHPYDEFVQILQGRLILTLDDGSEFKFEQGDSLVVPRGYTGYWEMPEQYRELIVIDTEALGSM